MLSIDVCKGILNKGKRKFKDEEIKQLREFLYLIAEFQIEFEENSDLENE